MSPVSCHDSAPGRQASTGTPIIALVGCPNVGKATLFNDLTGAQRQMGNWPGTTVEVGRGHLVAGDRAYSLLDLPGAYSLDAHSPDEALTRDLVLGSGHGERLDVVVVVADAGRLTRSLYLVRQLRERDQRVVLALTMIDVAARQGVHVDPEALSGMVGVPVVEVDPRQRRGGRSLLSAVDRSLEGAPPEVLPTPRSTDELEAAGERFAWIADVVGSSTARTRESREHWSDRVDRVALSPAAGPIMFLLAMWAVFQLTTAVAAPLQATLEWLVSAPITSVATTVLGALGLQGTWAQGLVVDGLIAGVGMLLTFVPLMGIMFVLLALLEDSGYLARAAVVTDRAMRAIGLPGRAFLPLIVGFGCNVPAIAATRILPHAPHRLLTALLVPFTSCSARLAVYVMVASVFFPDNAGTVVFVLYLVSIAFVVMVGLVLRSTLWRTMGAEPLVIDLPPYQRPTLRLTASVAWMRLRGFLRTASGIIVATVVFVWFVQAIPVTPGYSFGHVPVSDSLYAASAQAIAPVFAPAGFGSWEATSALMVGFVAKEAVVTSWAQTYAAEIGGDGGAALGAALVGDFAASSDGHPQAAAWAFLLFLLAYTPCVATLTAQRREIGTRWTVMGVAMQLCVAWTVAVVVFQIGARLW